MAPSLDTSTSLDQDLRRAGLRRTRAVQAVVGQFEGAAPGWAPTHADIADRLAEAGEPVNPVTLYRLLDRLLAAGLLTRHTAPGERVWRFRWRGLAAVAATATPHFECDACHAQFSLGEAAPSTQAIAAALQRTLAEHGHQAAWVDLAVHGTCAGCRGAPPGAGAS